MSVSSEPSRDANGVPAESARPHPAPPVYCGSKNAREPSLGRTLIRLFGGDYRVTPLPRPPESRTRAWLAILQGRPTGEFPPEIEVREHADADAGSQLAGYLGLSCSCGCYSRTGPACPHLVALVELGLVRPALDWDEVADLDSVWASEKPTHQAVLFSPPKEGPYSRKGGGL